MPTNEQEPHRELLKELDRLLDLDIDEAVREKLWELIMDVTEYRRRKGQKERQEPKR